MSRLAGRLVPALVLLAVLAPTAAGLLGTLLPAFGHLPAIGRTGFSLEPFERLLATPGLGRASLLSVASATLSTLLSLGAAVAIVAAVHGSEAERRLRAVLPPLLAVPHAAAAIAFAFLVAPSGLLVRLSAPILGLERPPDLATVQDPWALSLTLGLALRETPFLLFVLLAASERAGLDHLLAAARSLGRSRVAAWLDVAWPQLWPALRLPTMAVLAYGLAAVDMALVLGPNAPPVLSVLVLRWFNDPDLERRLVASAGAVLLLLLAAALILLAVAAERLLAALLRGRPWPVPLAAAIGALGRLLVVLVPATAFAGLAVLIGWSLAASWRFPAVLPTGPDLAAWAAALDRLAGPFAATAGIALACALLALLAVIAILEAAGRADRVTVLLWLPLLVPPIGFVFGLQVLWVLSGLADRPLLALIWAHLLFVLPYTWLVLRGPWLGLEPRLADAARSLGCGPLAVVRRVRLPLLARSILAALAVGISVSVAQYLVTLAAAGGRIATLATETMALVAGGDRRRIAVAALLLSAIPLAATALALLLPVPAERARRAAPRRASPQSLGKGAKRFSMSSSVKARPAPPPPSTPS
ncbi:MAG: ABC transporter permease [Geminicoccaceae bacterium]|nr:ABC transporter permease [Geminicoccaceae bacterium]